MKVYEVAVLLKALSTKKILIPHAQLGEATDKFLALSEAFLGKTE